MSIYQMFQNRATALNSALREWRPTEHRDHLALKFSNRYLSKGKGAIDDGAADLGEVVDPFNILRPVLRGEVHTADNVVQYWERVIKEDG